MNAEAWRAIGGMLKTLGIAMNAQLPLIWPSSPSAVLDIVARYGLTVLVVLLDVALRYGLSATAQDIEVVSEAGSHAARLRNRTPRDVALDFLYVGACRAAPDALDPFDRGTRGRVE